MRNHAGADNGSSQCEMALTLRKENTGSGRSDKPAYWYAQVQRMLRTSSLSSKKQMMEVAFISLQLQEGIKQPLCFKMPQQ